MGRKDLPTTAVLIRLGADSLLMNGHQHTPVQQLGVKCFPAVLPAANTAEKGMVLSWCYHKELLIGASLEGMIVELYRRDSFSVLRHIHTTPSMCIIMHNIAHWLRPHLIRITSMRINARHCLATTIGSFNLHYM